MKNTNPHIKFLRNSIILLVVLFSLTPCSVKESGSVLFNFEYQRPLNKTRVSFSQENSCNSLIFNQVETVQTQKTVDLDLRTVSISNPFLFSTVFGEVNQIKSSNASPDIGRPLYILYSRLKLDLA
ncbi:hypothetical protein OS188_05505 [Xanthomarina sp. F1114]|uniref:hypothetical protein n=1 Tax=Xanthomarina sp. F1114 TaxID=2996019 RepID=UPI00225DDCBB|nr:hypothetical protein [Xanthomarina sp. F1114]MCX7547408.1 hypothetical protein [Xanthomarina sp. F1114]